MSHWLEQKEVATGYFRLKILLTISRFLGPKILKIIIFPIVLVAFIVNANGRKYSKIYFEKLSVFTKNPKFKPSIINSFRHFYAFGISLIDRMQAWDGKITKNDLHFNNINDLNLFSKLLAQKKGIFILTDHIGSPDILRAITNKDAIINAFIETKVTPKFNAFIQSINSESNLNIYSIQDFGINTLFMIKDKLDRGEIVVMAADRTLPHSRFKERSFLGSNAKFPEGVFRLLRVLDSNFCFLTVAKSKKFEVYLHFLSSFDGKDIDLVIDKYIKWLERNLLEHPFQWFHFGKFWEN